MNITTVPAADVLSSHNVLIYLFGCVIFLLVVLVMLFGSVAEDSSCFIITKYIKIKVLKYCCCCCRDNDSKLKKNAIELKEILVNDDE